MTIKTESIAPIIDLYEGGASIQNVDGTIRLANKFALKSWGYKEGADINGTSYADIHCDAADFHEEFKFFHDRVLLSEKNEDSLCLLSYVDGWMTTLASMKPLYDKEGKIDSVIGSGIDISKYNIIDISRYLIADKNKQGWSTKSNQFIYYLTPPSSQLKLTDRELECLFFILRGKSSTEIGELLHISKRTVEMHSDSLKQKFTCNSKSQLIEQAILDGYMNFLPPSVIQICSRME